MQMEHWLNNEKVVDYVIGSDEWNDRFARSKFNNQCKGDDRTNFGKYPSGFIGMQGHGGGLLVWYKNIKIFQTNNFA